MHSSRAMAAALVGGVGGSALVVALVLVLVSGPDKPQVPAAPKPTPAGPVLDPVRSSGGASGKGQAPVPTAEGLERVLTPLLADDALGSRVGAVVVDASSGRRLFAASDQTPMSPASTAKITTAVAALTAIGPDAKLTTEVVRGPDRDEIVLVGGGDPTLSLLPRDDADRLDYLRPARLETLAQKTAAALRNAATPKVTLSYDDSLFEGPAISPEWESEYVPSGVVAPVSALTTDTGHLSAVSEHRMTAPAAHTAASFAQLLEDRGVAVRGTPSRAAAPAQPTELAAVSSPPMSALVQHMLTESDNDLAEALARHVAIAEGAPATFEDGAEAIRQVLRRLEVDTTGMALRDASGLARDNRITAGVVAQALFVAASPRHPELRPTATGLPVAGFTGTLLERFAGGRAGDAAGIVRAKTGSLTGVSSLAGFVRDADGRLLAFAFLVNSAPSSYAAEAALDRLAAALARCGCRAPASSTAASAEPATSPSTTSTASFSASYSTGASVPSPAAPPTVRAAKHVR
ncbi:MAG: D-alanyl-D-alanine carboxypeptidase/D-alanyl-D-alanine endopeptidase [Carbonactinosporaceae bacterium]